MTIRIRYSVQCDRCQRTREQASFDLDFALVQAVSMGWTEREGKHYCVGCTRRLEREEKRKQ